MRAKQNKTEWMKSPFDIEEGEKKIQKSMDIYNEKQQ
jgi:hypothetical protein